MNILIIGASKGIGLALSELLSVNSSLHLLRTTSDKKAYRLTETKDSMFFCDICDESSIDSLYQKLKHKVTSIDCVINCAGVLHNSDFLPEKSLNQICQDRFLKSFQVNSIGHLLILKALQPLLKKSERGVAVSLSARVGSIEDNYLGGWYSYRMSKAALNMGFKTLSIEWKRTCPQLKLLLIHPGTTDTNLSKPFQKNLKKGQLQSPTETADYIWKQILKVRNQTQKNLFIDFNGEKIKW